MIRGSILSTLSLVAAIAILALHGYAPAATVVPLYDFESEVQVWGGGAQVDQPVHSGKSAMQWVVGEPKNFDTARFVADWSQFDELRFWAYSAEANDFRIPVVFLCKGGYWLIDWRVDWTGWKEHRLRLADAKPMRSNIDWTEIKAIGFRPQGYGQKDIPKGMTLVFDDFSLYAEKEIASPGNLEEWIEEGPRRRLEALKATGNPYYAAVLDGLKGATARPEIPGDFDSAWKFRSYAEQALIAAWAAASDASARKGDETLVAYAVAYIDFILSRQKDGSWFYSRKWTGGGDPNTDRFTLGPTMDAVWHLRGLKDMSAEWGRWEKPLRQAVEFQRRHWGKPPDPNSGGGQKAWGAFGYIYPNQDVYHLIEMELAHRWWGDAAYRREVERTIAGLQAQLLPDGGLRYIGPEPECPVYHQLNLLWLARYLDLTGDERIRKLIADTVEYYPLTMTNGGFPESYTDCWWKHYWGSGSPMGADIVVGITGDGRNKWLANRCMEVAPPAARFASVFAGMFYRDDIQEAPLPDNWLVLDRNIGGPRGRFGDFYFAGVVGGGARDTFAGCMMADPRRANALAGALMAANVQIVDNDKTNWAQSRLYVSGPDDRTAIHVGKSAAALGARYTVRRAYYNTRFNPSIPPTPWQATQVWLFTAQGLVGLVEVEATEPMRALAVRGELRFGPRVTLEEVAPGDYLCGALTAKLLQHNYPEVEIARGAPAFKKKRTGHVTVNPTTTGNSYAARPGAPLWYAAAVGPRGFQPVGFERLASDKGHGLRVTIDGHAYEVLFHPEGRTIAVR